MSPVPCTTAGCCLGLSMASAAVARPSAIHCMNNPQGKATQKSPKDLLEEWRALEPARWEAPSPHKPLVTPGTFEIHVMTQTQPVAAKAEAAPAPGKASAQRTEELLDSWRAVTAQQQRNASLDYPELLQHQMSQMREGLGGMCFISLEYGR